MLALLLSYLYLATRSYNCDKVCVHGVVCRDSPKMNDNHTESESSTKAVDGDNFHDSKGAREPLTPFAIVAFCTVLAFLLAVFFPFYFSPYVGPLVIALLRVLAAFVFLFGVFAFYVGLHERPEVREFLGKVLHGLLIEPLGAFGNPGRDAWTVASFAAVLVVVAVFTHWIFISWFGFTGAFEIIIKVFVLGLSLLALMFLSSAIDDMIVKPLLLVLPSYQDPQSLDPLLRRIGKFVIGIVTLVGVVLSMIELFK